MSTYDIAIIGAGMAGLTAAKAGAAGGAKVIVLDGLGVGGQVSTVEGITNAPGFDEPVAGFELGVTLMAEGEAAGAEFMLGEAEGIEPADDGFAIASSEGTLHARAIILAAGSARRELGIPGEAEFAGRGVSRCASCDGPFFQGKRLVVVGGGDSAFDEARVLADVAGEVLIVHDEAAPTAREEIVAELRDHPRVTLRPRATLAAIEGADAVSGVRLRDLDSGEESELAADGVFVYIGLDPHTSWLGDLVELSDTGHVVADERCRTSRPGVLVAGDIRQGSAAMLDEAARDGTVAAQEARTYLASS
ncbi:MAG TPA: FAD-dependent oxidoreductase [Actinomycetaceae bacterium]|nr:FAD-dependent oxidoreductase [Actinomycetaceae bacterium]